MKFLLKILCLLSLLSSFCFAELERVFVLSKEAVQSLSRSPVEYGFLKGQEFFFYKSADRNVNVLRRVSSVETYYILDTSVSPGLYSYGGELFLVEGVYKTGLFYFNRSIGYTDFYYFGSGDSHSYTLAYHIILDWGIDCKYSENFDINSKKCFPACQAGESWDIENSICYSDCTDKDINKFGFPNGTAQGGCIDCSSAFSNYDISSCLCAGYGTSIGDKLVFLNPDGPFVSTSCADGMSITFKKRSNEKPDKEKDKEKDKENPEPDKDKKNDNNSTNSSNKDNPNPDKKDNNENSNNSSGESGNSSNNNSGGSAGNGSSGGGGTGVETKPNPNYNGNGKEDGKSDGKGEDGKGDDAVAGKLDYDNLEKDMNNFQGDYSKAIEDSFSFVNDVKASLTDTLQKIKDGNLMSFQKSAVPTTCPLNFQIDMTYFSKNLTFDICKSISSASQTLYYFFYVAFFVLFLVLIIKLFLFTFLGW